jgi:TraX protein
MSLSWQGPLTGCAARQVQARLELAKWTALLAMAIDHYGKIVDPGIYLQTHLIGRVSFPLFAAIIGLRLAEMPELGPRYLGRLIPWAVISQPVYVVAGRAWFDGNIMVTLALGAGIVVAWRRRSFPATFLVFVGIAVLSWFADFGPFGAAMIPAIAALARVHFVAALLAIGPLGVLANLHSAPPFVQPADLAALPATGVALLSLTLPRRLPRLPRTLFYAFYPAHLLALDLYDRYG